MAEMIVAVRDKLPVDDPLHALSYRAGDVLCFMDDGWQFSERERTHPNWMHVRLEGGARPELLEPLLDAQGGLVSYRMLKLDVRKLKPKMTNAELIAATLPQRGQVEVG